MRTVLEAWNYSQDSRSLRDIEEHPSGALLDGMVLMANEIADREGQRRRDQDEEARARAGQASRSGRRRS